MEEEIKQNRGFKGIWIPKEIWLNKELTMQEKVFLVEIDSLDNEEGCTAGNQYFADFFGISKTRVSLVIQNLISKGYITSKLVYKEGSKQILYRVLNICRPPYPTFVIEGMQQKLNTPIQQKLKDNNTYNNNTNNNKNNKYIYYGEYKNVFFTEEQYQKLIAEFPDDYNERIETLSGYMQSTGKKYKDCLATIRNWARKEKKGANNAKPKRDYGGLDLSRFE